MNYYKLTLIRVGLPLFMLLSCFLLALPVQAQSAKETAKKETPNVDERGTFASSFYLGAAIDTFAGDETLKFLNFQDSSDLHARAVGGIDFGYRLFGDQNRAIPDNKKSVLRVNDLWIYGETVHGVRSADVPCQAAAGQTAQSNQLICGNKLVPSPTPGQDFVFVLRNATSLEAYAGLRWEFLGLQQQSSAPANLYVKAQAGFVDVAGLKGPAKAEHHIGAGAVATSGDFRDSYLEVGWGRSDIFQQNHGRWKIDAYLERKLTKGISIFAQINVDTHLGRGSDAVQSYIGFNYDLSKLPGSK